MQARVLFGTIFCLILYFVVIKGAIVMIYTIPQTFPDEVLRIINAGIGDLGQSNANREMHSGGVAAGALVATAGAANAASAEHFTGTLAKNDAAAKDQSEKDIAGGTTAPPQDGKTTPGAEDASTQANEDGTANANVDAMTQDQTNATSGGDSGQGQDSGQGAKDIAQGTQNPQNDVQAAENGFNGEHGSNAPNASTPGAAAAESGPAAPEQSISGANQSKINSEELAQSNQMDHKN